MSYNVSLEVCVLYFLDCLSKQLSNCLERQSMVALLLHFFKKFFAVVKFMSYFLNSFSNLVIFYILAIDCCWSPLVTGAKNLSQMYRVLSDQSKM